MFHLQLGSVEVFTGTLLGAEGEREQLTLSCSVRNTQAQDSVANIQSGSKVNQYMQSANHALAKSRFASL